MKRTYTLFVATDELLTCPEIYQHAKNHNLILTPHTSRTMSIVTPLEHPIGAPESTHVNFDPAMVDVALVHLMTEGGLLYITLTLRALDVGVTDITLDIPKATDSPLPTAHELIRD